MGEQRATTGSPRLATFEAYQSAWVSGIDADERRRRLAACVAEDCVYTDPAFECHGHAELARKIEHSAQHFPGARFRNDSFLDHHGQGLVQWTMFDGAGHEFVRGASYVRFGGDGRLTHMTGFFAAPGREFQPAAR